MEVIVDLQLVTARYSNKRLADEPGSKVRITMGAPRFPLPYRLDATIKSWRRPLALFGLEPERFTHLYHWPDAGEPSFDIDS